MTYAPRSTPTLEAANRDTSVASQTGSRFTDRLAAHLADVKNADRAHKIVTTEVVQKVEALTRVAAETHEMTRELLGRLSPELGERVSDGARERLSSAFGAGPIPGELLTATKLNLLMVALGGNEEPDEDGPDGPDMTPRDVTGPTGAP